MNTLNLGNQEEIKIDQYQDSKNQMKQNIDNVNNGMLSDIRLNSNFKNKNREKTLFSTSQIKGIREESPLSQYFFSNDNIEGIQKSIRYDIYNKTNNVVDFQSTNELLIIMRSIFLKFADNSVNSLDFLPHLLSLNQKVIDFSVGQIDTQVQQYGSYISRLESLPVPLELPQQVDRNNFTYNMDNLMN